MNKIKVVLAEDHQVVRQGMVALLNVQPDIEVIGEAADGLKLLELVGELNPQVVLSDIAMPHLNGIEAIGQITKRFPNVRMIILSMHSASPYVIRALRGGAWGYLLKDDDIEDVVRAIRSVMNGARFLSRQVSEQVVDVFASESTPIAINLEKRISERERNILQLIGEGNSNAQIAEKLTLSPRSVEKHRANLMTKLSLQSQSDVVRFALQQGLIPLTSYPLHR
jgi:two-component system response regulator NreC